MKLLRSRILSFLLLLSVGIWLSLSVGGFKTPAQAAWEKFVSTPASERCALLQHKSVEFVVNLQPDGTWQGVQRSAAVNSLQGQGTPIAGASLADLRAFLLDNPCGISSLAGTITLELSGIVRAGQAFQLVLPANPSTGYLWEVEEEERNLAVTSEEAQLRQMEPRIGGMAAQIVPFRGLRSTTATIRLWYQRPWEADQTAKVSYLVNGEGVSLSELAQSLSLPIPQSELESPNSLQVLPLESTPVPLEIASAQELPAWFNWCSLGKCTPVRDQRNCGSCWAFATVGVFESKLLIADNNSQDLSEQYLVSCNTDGWGCNGGWFAHDYHIWKTPPSESEAGAVWESSFPYQAKDLPCSGPYTHPFRALSWSYVNRNVNIPSVAEIKQAILNYGPVGAAVCVGPAFDSYRGGVFSTDEKSVCGSSMVNHGIVLVGWDDAQGVWILRNSWGPSWGESGYMRIRYGISNVGLGANYLVYNPSPSPTTPAPTTPPPTTAAPTTPPPTTAAPTTPPPTTPEPYPSPYPPPPPGRSSIYLPFVLKPIPLSVLLPNGDFEQGKVIWQEYSKKGYDLIYNINQTQNAAPPYSGTWATWLGGAYDEISFLQQTVLIPTDSPILSYWQWIDSADVCGYDFGGVLVNNSVVEVYPLCADQETQGWVLHTIDLSAYTGQSVILQIRAETDQVNNSNLFVDRVGFQALASPSLQRPLLFSQDSIGTKAANGMPIVSTQTLELKRMFSP